MMLSNGSQMPIIVSDKLELRRCIMHLWPNFPGIGLNIKPSKVVNKVSMPHLVKDVDVDSPAQYAGVLNNDFIIKVGDRIVEHEKFDNLLKLIKEQLKREKKVDLLLINSVYYPEFKRKNEPEGNRRIDYNSPRLLSQVKYYESPLFNPNGSSRPGSAGPSSAHNTLKSLPKSDGTATVNSNPLGNSMNTTTTASQMASQMTTESMLPEPRLCHLLTWSNYDGYGFYVAYSNDRNACYIKNVEPNSPAHLGGLRAYDRLIEVNGKRVSARDKDIIQREIYKYRSQMNGGTKKSSKSTKSSSRPRSVSSTRQNYLNLFVADPSTYKWLNSRKVDLSTRNKQLKVQECFTPPENSLLTLMNPATNLNTNLNGKTTTGTMRSTGSTIKLGDNMIAGPIPPPPPPQQPQQPPAQIGMSSFSSGQRALQLNQSILDSIILKYCTLRRLRNSEDKPLGFEMTKRGQTAHFISRVEPSSAAALSGLCADDYLIELNEQNIEHDDNSLLREKIFKCLEPQNGGEFKFTTMNKPGYEYCLENGIEPGYFVQLNKSKIKSFETPRELSAISGGSTQSRASTPPPPLPLPIPMPTPLSANINTQQQQQQQPPPLPPPIITHTLPHNPAPYAPHQLPRLCLLRKTPDVRELGFSIIRMKNFSDHIVNDVIPGSLADSSGLLVNDCLIEVNGENVEGRTHLETVNRIHELTKQPNSDISLLVVQKNILRTSSQRSPSSPPSPSTHSHGSVTTNTQNTSSSHLHHQHSRSESAGATASININNNLSSIADSVTFVEKPHVAKHIDTNGGVGRKVITNHMASVNVEAPPSINVYPEIKVCEFQGYPQGTQLGLVVTSDDYSHDIIKVTEGSPAHRVGLAEGDVIIAINDINIEGSPNAIELLNDFDEHNHPLRILAASRYALEWSKLLRIKITEKDWPNVKKNTTRHTSNNHNSINSKVHKSKAYSPHNTTTPLPHYTTTTTIQHTNLSRPSSPPLLPANCYYQPPPLNISHHHHHQQKRNSNNSQYNLNTTAGPSSGHNTVRSIRSYYTSGGNEQQQQQQQTFFTLSRSAVDITTDGKVLRLCTLLLDPSSPSPLDAEFGFDLVTKIGANQKIGDYFIDTVDDESPASVSGLKPGDRLLEVDGIDLSNRTFEQVVQLIGEAKLHGKLRLLVYPSIVINYGNPNVNVNNAAMSATNRHSDDSYGTNISYADSRSMPDLNQAEMVNQQIQMQQNTKVVYKQKKSASSKHAQKDSNASNSNPNTYTDYDSIYLKRNSNGAVSNSGVSLSHSVANITNASQPVNNGMSSSKPITINTLSRPFSASSNFTPGISDFLKPVARLCTVMKSTSSLTGPDSLNNLGFGVHLKQTSALIPNYLRVSIVNYKSPAYLAGLEAGDYIIEVNSRNTMQMSHEEALHFIKSSYEMNNQVRILVASEFCYNWLREHSALYKLSTEDSSVFSYSDYLKSNHRFVPRLCKIRTFPFSKSFGFSLETFNLTPPTNIVPKTVSNYAHLITRVEDETPAFSASLQKNDRIIECDGVNVEAENERQITERIYQAFVGSKQISLFVVDPDTDRFFKSKCIKLHSMLPIVQHIANSTDI